MERYLNHQVEKVVVITGKPDQELCSLAKWLQNDKTKVILAHHSILTAEDREGVFFVSCDTIRKERVEAMLQAVVERFGRVDTLIHCVSPQPPKKLLDELCPENKLDEVDFSMAWGVGIKSVYVCAQAAARQMKQQRGGTIVILLPKTEDSTLTKSTNAAVKILCERWTEELKESQVTVTYREIAPLSKLETDTGAKAILDSVHTEEWHRP